LSTAVLWTAQVGTVYHLLEQDGFNVRIVQNSTVSLDGDVAA